MTDKVQHNIDQMKKLAASSAARKGNSPVVSRSQDSLAKVIRNEREAAIFSAELEAIVMMARKK
jgi:hypothetical protein